MVGDRLNLCDPHPFIVVFRDIVAKHLVFCCALLTKDGFLASIDDEIPACIVWAFAGDIVVQMLVLRQYANAGFQHNRELSDVNFRYLFMKCLNVCQIGASSHDKLDG